MAKLYYFNGRGRGEIIRLMLATADIQVSTSFKVQIHMYLTNNKRVHKNTTCKSKLCHVCAYHIHSNSPYVHKRS